MEAMAIRKLILWIRSNHMGSEKKFLGSKLLEQETHLRHCPKTTEDGPAILLAGGEFPGGFLKEK